jgi:hypothetical protein
MSNVLLRFQDCSPMLSDKSLEVRKTKRNESNERVKDGIQELVACGIQDLLRYGATEVLTSQIPIVVRRGKGKRKKKKIIVRANVMLDIQVRHYLAGKWCARNRPRESARGAVIGTQMPER